MSKVVRAQVMGYCMGVQRAVNLAEEAMRQGEKIYALGPIIHNAKEIERLTALGMVTLPEDATPTEGSTVLIRAHGLHPVRHQELKEMSLQLIDATCPLVVKNQRSVSVSDEANLTVIIVGKPDHAEIRALLGFAQKSVIISSIEEAQELELEEKTVAIIAQTTLRPALYDEIKAVLALKFTLIEKGQSICPATQERQAAIKALAQQVSAIVVVGDTTSANTRGLLETVQQLGLVGYLVAGREDMPLDELRQWPVIGLSAGASAPEWLIDEVEEVLLQLS